MQQYNAIGLKEPIWNGRNDETEYLKQMPTFWKNMYHP